jgi:hypothetical protein
MEDNIKIDVKETGWRVVDCIYLTQDRHMLWARVIDRVS